MPPLPKRTPEKKKKQVNGKTSSVIFITMNFSPISMGVSLKEKNLFPHKLIKVASLCKNDKTSYCSHARPKRVFDIGHCMVIHYDAGGVSLVEEKN